MSQHKNKSNKLIFYISAWFLIWIILFEFILPVNNILPRPTIVIRSFASLWSNYNLLLNFLSTVSVIYISLFVSFLLIRFLRKAFLHKRGFIYDFLLSLEWFSDYLPGIIIGILLIFWFPQSEFIEFIFAFFIAFASMSISLNRLSSSVNKDYTDAALSLGLKNSRLTLIEFNSVVPLLSSRIIGLHFYLWSMLIIFEFIKGGLGIGFMLRQAFEYRDLSAFFAASIITGMTIYAGTLLLRFIKDKHFGWS